ncbi:COG1361 family protein [Halobacterium noricense]|uniref:hypothetical protein n=1 Tax=Halobacterium noricense TaxID=223182 RepID=UPI001E5BACB3|nr:hypothetical protein [Halobacterium noricense]UHH26645.1 hypothetical protein LT974_06855 [Halobacterium noricense]
MTRHLQDLDRRTALRTVASAALAGIAGCLSQDSSPGNGSSAVDGPLQQVTVDGTAVVVGLASEADVDRINLIQPNGELFAQQAVAAGVQQVSFEIGATYPPGEYDIVALQGEETVTEHSFQLQPEIHIRAVGLFRNHPEKPWDEVYGESETDRLKNGEAFVTVENTGTGPEAVVELIFLGDVPNPLENPRGNGMYETERVVVPPGETVDLFSGSFPFGSESESGMGCSPSGNSGQFTVTVKTQHSDGPASNTFDVQYSGSNDMVDCEVSITEA